MFFGQHDGPAEIGEGDALSCTACSEVAIASLDVATSLREQPFSQMLKYFVDATPQFCLGNFCISLVRAEALNFSINSSARLSAWRSMRRTKRRAIIKSSGHNQKLMISYLEIST